VKNDPKPSLAASDNHSGNRDPNTNFIAATLKLTLIGVRQSVVAGCFFLIAATLTCIKDVMNCCHDS